MSNFKITDLTNYTNPDAANDVIEIVDIANNQNKKITRNNLLGLASAPVGLTDSQTLTNKVLTAPTLASPILSGTITGTYTLAGTPTFPAAVVTLTGSQTLTNKILTSPTINAPTITNASITADALTGFTTSNTGSIYGVAVTGGLIAGSSVTNIPAASLGTGAITLGYAQITAGTSTASSTATQITGLTATVTIPAGGRRIEIVACIPQISPSSASDIIISVWDGTVGSGTQLQSFRQSIPTNFNLSFLVSASTVPAAGSKTYNIGFANTGSFTTTLTASTTQPAYIWVKAV